MFKLEDFVVYNSICCPMEITWNQNPLSSQFVILNGNMSESFKCLINFLYLPATKIKVFGCM